jgi:PBP1b-binding outer membrane lipoprotein LpoB
MKKIFVILTAALMTTVFVSCGNKTAGVSEVADSTAVDSIAVVDSTVVADSIVADSTVCAE